MWASRLILVGHLGILGALEPLIIHVVCTCSEAEGVDIWLDA